MRLVVAVALVGLLSACQDGAGPAAPQASAVPEATVAMPDRPVRANLVPQFGAPPLELRQVRSFGTGGKSEVTDFFALPNDVRGGAILGRTFLLGQQIPETQLLFSCERQRAIGELTDFYFSFDGNCAEFNGTRVRGPNRVALDPVRVFVSPEAGIRAGYNTVPVLACRTVARDSQRRDRGIDLYTSTQSNPLCFGPTQFTETFGRFVLVLGWAVVP
ncbi:MAG: hypothetical protein MUF00_06865 [Gemmatimonadaceae bacterium]|jgi:hypothetical protein|nr:hypothetical protein [Gemmatimonadaceae bacterium]